MQDLRFSLRVLAKNPAFSVAAILCLALGIGATTAIFSVVDAVLIRPLPFAEPSRLVRVYSEFPTFPNGGLHRFWVSAPEFLDLRRETKSWESLDAWSTGGVNLAGSTDPVRVTAASVSGGMLQTLGVAPVLGRTLQPADDVPGANRAANISYGIWQSVFGADPAIVGREVLLNGRKCAIIGVMPRGFSFPPGEPDPPQVWTALQIDPAKPGGRASHYLYLLGRLKPGVGAAQAQAELDALTRSWGEKKAPKTHAFSPKNHTLVSFPLQQEVVAGVRPALLMLLGAVGFVLLIACINVANLLLARAEARRREMAIRGALGAGVVRMARQFATEGILLALCGGILGVGLAYGSLQVIRVTNAGGIPRAAEISVDGRVLLFTLLISLATGIVFGVAPMIPLFLKDISGALKDTGTSTTGSAGAQLFRRMLVGGEIALALVLLTGCGLMIRAFWALQQVHTGVRPDRVITMRVALPGATYSEDGKIDGFWGRLEERIRRLPGVESAALASRLPPSRPPDMNDTMIEGFVPREGGPIQNVDFYQVVSHDYFAAMGIRLMSGRFFDARDVKGAPDVVIINHTMAQTFWPGQDPLGRRVQPGDSDPWCTVIGVVDDVKNAGLDKPAGTELYLPYSQTQGSGTRTMYVVIRGREAPVPLSAAVRRELQDLDPTLPLAEVRLMSDVVSLAQARPRFLTILMTLFSIVALAIATVGIYGVISYTVARRTKEFGLRMVLGAEPGRVVALVMRQGGAIVAGGVVAGVLAALGLTHLMRSVLFSVEPTDPATFAIVAVILAAVALGATFVPARRATRVDPLVTLRYE
jgi:putative ABC transport system permease protein